MDTNYTPRTDAEEPKINTHKGGWVRSAFARSLERELNEARLNEAAALNLVAEIRAALGDPEGKMMQDELIEHCRKLATLQEAIDEFCLHNAWSTDQWKSNPTAKGLFELRTKF